MTELTLFFTNTQYSPQHKVYVICTVPSEYIFLERLLSWDSYHKILTFHFWAIVLKMEFGFSAACDMQLTSAGATAQQPNGFFLNPSSISTEEDCRNKYSYYCFINYDNTEYFSMSLVISWSCRPIICLRFPYSLFGDIITKY